MPGFRQHSSKNDVYRIGDSPEQRNSNDEASAKHEL